MSGQSSVVVGGTIASGRLLANSLIISSEVFECAVLIFTGNLPE